MPYVTSIERIAREEGLTQGLTEGRSEGTVETVLRQLRRRCGVLSPEIVEEIRRLPQARLEQLAEALLDFKSACDLHTWLQ